MTLLSSLRSRIFLGSALLAVLSIGVALYLVNVRVTDEAERTLDRELTATATLVDNLRTGRAETYRQMARFIADAPRLKAAVDTNDPPTVDDVAKQYQNQIKSDLLIVTSRSGEILATIGTSSAREALIVTNQAAVRSALSGKESSIAIPQPNGIVQLVTVPLYVDYRGVQRPDILGTVSVGFLLDNTIAEQLKRQTGSDIAFGMDGQILASSVPRGDYSALAGRLRTSGISQTLVGSEEYAVLPRPLSSESALGSGPVALIMRSRTEQLRLLAPIRNGLVATAVVAIILAIVFSFTIARTITRPIAAITDVMREVAATGDLTRKIALGSGRWNDEDARLLATTFNTLTDSVARFQREMSQKERLTSLGRLSTVIAHEIRNPLMIIKASLHGLGQPGVDATTIREAIADIDEEVARLNRIVNEVLDFARPIKFDFAPVDVNALCRESATAAKASGPGPAIEMDLDSKLAPVTSDSERLRLALVNLLVNARHATDGAEAPRQGPPDSSVRLKTRANGSHVQISVIDRGVGIAASDLMHVFDPYFTTKRGGTGLGLPIAKNIVEGLGGTIGVTSAPGLGTEIRIDLPA